MLWTYQHNDPIEIVNREVVDPVCGMSIASADATRSADYEGSKYCFCNPSWAEKFRAIPHAFVGDNRPAKGPRPSRRKIFKTAGRTPQELLAQYVAPTFVLVLDWWVESNGALSPKDIDGLFRALTLPTLSCKPGVRRAGMDNPHVSALMTRG